MATGFGVDTGAASDVARELAEVRTNLWGAFVDRRVEVTGSRRVADALHRFFDESSDRRTAIDQFLDRAEGLLRGLVDGTTAVDVALRDAMTAPVAASAPTPVLPSGGGEGS